MKDARLCHYCFGCMNGTPFAASTAAADDVYVQGCMCSLCPGCFDHREQRPARAVCGQSLGKRKAAKKAKLCHWCAEIQLDNYDDFARTTVPFHFQPQRLPQHQAQLQLLQLMDAPVPAEEHVRASTDDDEKIMFTGIPRPVDDSVPADDVSVVHIMIDDAPVTQTQRWSKIIQPSPVSISSCSGRGWTWQVDEQLSF